ncbi:uncharacterized protein LAESUDRAFT_731104 [Laetiporus sulphureus 93-53]|uniref:Uncharacterized protein n=1 Tax=Laetiporus sulphureus 93-53 TaxID=1314785 RepID=A0A165BRQ0_9APHY|nr:uncharacterized protein LAESUDRAFT_731104 [Laetiporus sulphureus 93-53]KZT01531.1 hypothetical protein LAESUDRAFT_731104 [Laetiporus sulphureus 93-53]
MDVSTYGRSRQSIADLEQELHDIFSDHPQSHLNDDGEPIIPGNALVDVLRAFSRNHDAVDLMKPEEEAQLTQLLESNPGLAVTPQVLLQFIAMRTTFSPDESPEGSPPHPSDELEQRGRTEERDYNESHSRSSSRDSTGTSILRPPSRGPPVPPKDSPFDATRRQRSTPLNTTTAPSSWTRRRPPTSKRTPSQDRSTSDSDSSNPPSAYSRTSGRKRGPSNPISPTSIDASMSPIDSPSYPISISRPQSRAGSRPHSRAQSRSTSRNLSLTQDHFASLDAELDEHNLASPESSIDYGPQVRSISGLMSPPPSGQSETSYDDDNDFTERVSTLPMPRMGVESDESESEFDDASILGLVMSRSTTSSTVSLDLHERLDALQRANTDLARKLLEAEKTLQDRLAEHEIEIEEMESRLDEVRGELSATKREEKELRNKERASQSQITILEGEVTKLTKSLESARASYQSLQKQYQEQCAEAERYRDSLRLKDREVRTLRETIALQTVENNKMLHDIATAEDRINVLENKLVSASHTASQLSDQKNENLLLKETIDRLRFDIDELRNSTTNSNFLSGAGGTAQSDSAKTLGSEMDRAEEQAKAAEDVNEEAEVSAQLTLTEEQEDEDDEDFVETIITRTKRKKPNRVNRGESIKVDEVKEYCDSAAQHEIAEFIASCGIQTDAEPSALTASFSIQTDTPSLSSLSIQTDPAPEAVPEVRPMANVEIQTEEMETELIPSTSSSFTLSEDDDETLASSSSTLLPPTPKAQHEELHPHTHDLPPDYNQVTGQDRDELALRVANETLKKWHKGLKLPIEPVKGGISEDAAEDWKALKEELGVECAAIDKMVEESAKHRSPRAGKDGEHRRRRSRFYNIYNTYFLGESEGGSAMSTTQFLFCIGASAAVAFIVGQAMAPHYVVPGGPTYYDRVAWSSFNSIQATGEGFPGDGSTAIWNVLGRLLGFGATRQLRAWPT